MTDEREYILGTDPAELDRLRFQNHVWREALHALLARAGVRAGDQVLDLGCGPGFTTFELAEHVGPRGQVIALDESARFLEYVAVESARRGFAHVEPRHASVEELDDDARFDCAYARWLFCWLGDPGAVLERVARALQPGGALLVQDYFDWGGMKVVPRVPSFDRGVEACMASWRAGGGTIDIGEVLPGLAVRAGLTVELLRPVARIGAVGSLEWRWIDKFFRSYLPKVVERGLLQPAELEAWLVDWQRLTDEGTCHVYAPLVFDAVLRKPATAR